MLPRYVTDDFSTTWIQHFFGMLFFLLSCALTANLLGFYLYDPMILGEQTNNGEVSPLSTTSSDSNPTPSEVPFSFIIQSAEQMSQLIIRNDSHALSVMLSDNSHMFARVIADPDLEATELPIPSRPTQDESLINNSQRIFSDVFDRPDESTALSIGAIPRVFLRSELNTWLSRYKLQIWPVGASQIAFSKNGIVAITRYPIKLALSKLSLRIVTDLGDRQILYYPDSIWSYLASMKLVNEDASVKPLILDRDGEDITYTVEALSGQLMLAILPSTICRTIVISARTQEIKSIEPCSRIDAIIDAVSITL